jgi:hypothetical protein
MATRLPLPRGNPRVRRRYIAPDESQKRAAVVGALPLGH